VIVRYVAGGGPSNPICVVIYNANGGTGTMAPQSNNVPASLTPNAFTRSGYTFAGWNTAANGSGTSYANGATYSFTADVTLYAQWTVVGQPPAIAVQPTNITVNAGQTAAFSVTATGSAPLFYQWSTNNVSISGATNASYTTLATTTNDTGKLFKVAVSNAYGSVTSSNATLTVNAVTAQPNGPVFTTF